MQRLLLFLIFMGLGTGAIYLLTVREPPPEEAPVAHGAINVLRMEGVRVRQQEDNRLRFELTALDAEMDQTSGVTRLNEVRFTIHEAYRGERETVSMRGRAGMAVMERPKGKVVLSGGVELTDSTGTQFRSDRLDYDEKAQTVTSPGSVWVKANGTTHEGKSMVYDLPSRRFTLAAPRFYE